MSDSPVRQTRRCTLIFILVLLFGAARVGRVAGAQTASDSARPVIAGAVMPGPLPLTGVGDAPTANLPEAPIPATVPAMEASTASQGEPDSLPEGPDIMSPETGPMGIGVSPRVSARVPLSQCPDDKTHAKECRPHWHQLIITSSVFNAFQNTGNLYTSYWYRYWTGRGNWFQDWFNSDLGWRWGQWHDGNPFLDDYIGHGMMGSITNYMWLQNDPKGMTVDLANSREYWHSRLRAFVYSTAYSFEWKFGPFGEAGFGHNGSHPTDYVNGVLQNDTGDVELVTTPVVGLGWTIAEDFLDQHVVRKFEERPRGLFELIGISFLTPSRATANIFRWRPPWYRDGRQVKARTFWSEPPGPDDEVAASEPAPSARQPVTVTGGATALVPVRKGEALPVWPHYGGVHEFSAWWGLSLMTGHLWGHTSDVKFMPIDLQYSYLINPGAKWNFRYSPEVTALAMMDQPIAGTTSDTNPEELRMRSYGSGVSPVGFRASFYPESRVQPYFSTNGGFLYFDQRVLSPGGSQFMYTIDFGTGITIFRKRRQSVSIGYRYEHMSNAGPSTQNPGTDANTFYVQVSRFRTKGYR